MIGYGIGAFAVGPLRDVDNLDLSMVYCDATVLAVVLARTPRDAAVPEKRRI